MLSPNENCQEYEDTVKETVHIIIENRTGCEADNDESSWAINSSSLMIDNFYYDDKFDSVEETNDSDIKICALGDSETNSDEDLGKMFTANYFSKESCDKSVLVILKNNTESKENVGEKLCCPHCPSTFTLVCNRDNHIDVIHNGQRFECIKCRQQFTSTYMLKRHTRVVHDNVQCTLCNVIFTTTEARLAHKCNKRQKSVMCDRCPRTFSCQSNLNKHARVAHDGVVYPCPVCDKSRRSRESVVEHIRTAHALFMCTKCDELTKTEAEFTAHVSRKHHTAIESNICRDIGNEGVGSRRVAREEEVGLPHVPKRKFKTRRERLCVSCDKCGKTFSNASNLNKHIQTLHQNRKNVRCSLCLRGFSSKLSLKCHMVSVHPDVFYTCPTCFLQFPQRPALLRHLQTVHAGAPTGQLDGKPMCLCEICGKSFRNETSLKRHVKTDHDFHRYRCNICTLSFRTQDLARDHQRVDHQGQPFVCTDCPTNFRTRIGLGDHRRATHGTTQTYVCTICATSFTSRSQLTLHVRRSHKKPEVIPDELILHEEIMCDIFEYNEADLLGLHCAEDNDILLQAARMAGIDILNQSQ